MMIANGNVAFLAVLQKSKSSAPIHQLQFTSMEARGTHGTGGMITQRDTALVVIASPRRSLVRHAAQWQLDGGRREEACGALALF